MRRRPLFGISGLVLGASTLLGCTQLAVKAPDGHAVAFVNERSALGVGAPGLWVRFEGNREVRVQDLKADTHCNRALWTPDSTRVVFLVESDVRPVEMVVVSAVSASNVASGSVLLPLPTSEMTNDNPRMSEDGRSLTISVPAGRHAPTRIPLYAAELSPVRK